MSDILLDGHLHRGCGGHYVQITVPTTIKRSGMSATVTRSAFRCDVCGDEQRTLEQREAAEQAAVDAMRGEHRLLTPREVRKLRESLGLTAEMFGALLYGTPRGVIEGWEKARYVQNPETDALMRSLADRAVLERRAARAGVTLPPLPGSEPAPDAVEPAAAPETHDATAA